MVTERKARVSVQPINVISPVNTVVDWHDQAKCRDSGEDSITPENPGAFVHRYCTACPVRLECGEDALDYDDQFGCKSLGIWGGVFLPYHQKQHAQAIARLREVCATLRIDVA